MRQVLCLVVLVAAATAPVVAATPLIAMRVEVLPASGAAASAVLELQIAPEDRGRVGRSAWLEARLERDGKVAGRLTRAVEPDRDGLVRLEVDWPPGAFELRVDLDSGDRRHSGFWRGRVTVPAPSPPPAAPTAPAAAPGVGPAPAAASRGATASADAAAAAPERPAAATPTAAPAPAAATPMAAGLEPWAAGAAGMRELTAIVTDADGAPARLSPTDLELEIGGDRRPVEAVGDAAAAPLELALVVDVSPTPPGDGTSVARALGRLAARADEGRGRVLLSSTSGGPGPPDRDVPPGGVADALAGAGGDVVGDLALALGEILDALAARPGRRVAVVVTDGRRGSDRSAWRAAAAAAERAAAPVLIAGLWSRDFDAGTRRELRELAEATGGQLFLVQDPDDVAATLEDYGRLADAAVSLRITPAAGRVRLRVVPPGLAVRAPLELR